MKRLMSVYDSFKLAIRIAFFGFALIAFGFLIQNPSVNIFYTFRNKFLLFIAEYFLKIGESIIMNLPLVFIFSLVTKKSNSGAPIVMSLTGYFAFLCMTMLFGNQSLGSGAYMTDTGINSILNVSTGTRLPLATGLVGCLIVAYLTRVSFIVSRHRSAGSFLGFLNKDSAGIVYNICLCGFAGLLVAYAYPFFYSGISSLIGYIAGDLMDPSRIAAYSMADRVLSIFGLGDMIRQPFWYTALGGSYSNSLTGQNILGDVNIWSYFVNGSAYVNGCGRFITPYYVINMFIIPGIYLGTLLSMSDRKERHSMLLTFLLGIGLSVVAGNPLPVELLMLFTTPMLLIAYIGCIGVVSYALVANGWFLGFSSHTTNTVVAMPGAFPDFVINLRNATLFNSLTGILLVGAISFLVIFAITLIYYRVFAYDIVGSGKADALSLRIVEAVGGFDNIVSAGSGLFKINIDVSDLEAISYDQLSDIGAKRIVETKTGVSIALGSSSHIIAKKIMFEKSKLIKKNEDVA